MNDNLLQSLQCLQSQAPCLHARLLAQDHAVLEVLDLASGDRLLTKGDIAVAAYVVSSGLLRATDVREDGNELVLSTIGEGRLAGELAIITGKGTYSANVNALEPTRLVKIPAAVFERIVREHPEVLGELSVSVTQRMARDQLAVGLTRLFGTLNEDVLRFVEARVEWIQLHAGDVLFREGDTQRSLYFILGGRLRALSASGRVLGEMSRGESIGEIALLTGEPRSATVVAVRDSGLVRIMPEAFEEIVARYPRVLQVLASIVVKRLRAHERSREPSPSGTCITVARLASTPIMATAVVQLVQAFGRIGNTLHLTSARVDQLLNRKGIAQAARDDAAGVSLTAWLEEQEDAYRFVIYEPDEQDTEWTRRCLRQADDIVLLAAGGTDPGVIPAEGEILRGASSLSKARQSLLLVHPQEVGLPAGTARWLDALPGLARHYHVHIDQESDYTRAARCIAGTALGVVFGGGGARGLAHIGVIRALHECGVPVDLIGGTSMGAVIGAAYGMGHDWQEILSISRTGWLQYKPHKEYTLPFMSLIRTRVLDRWARDIYGDTDIEDLWLNFYCVSCNLTKSEMVVLDRGSLWRGVRASSSLPGVFVPVMRDGSVFVDGAIVNNLPGDIMRTRPSQHVVVIDVGSETTFAFAHEEFPSPWQYLWNRLLPFRARIDVPNIATVLLRTTEVSSIQKTNAVKRDADLCLRPPVDRYGVLDFESIDKIVEAGYRYAMEVIEQRADLPWLRGH